MFYSLTGKLVFADTQSVAIDCGGVAYHCLVSLATAGSVGPIGSTVKVYTYLSVRDNAMELYGFSTQEELEWFKLLTSVTSIGPRTGLGILSHIRPEQLALHIAASDYKSLTAAPGVGNKTAQRIVLELKDKISNAELVKSVSGGPAITIGGGNINEAIAALVALGYSQSDAASALAGVSGDTPTQDLIKIALKALAAK